MDGKTVNIFIGAILIYGFGFVTGILYNKVVEIQRNEINIPSGNTCDNELASTSYYPSTN